MFVAIQAVQKAPVPCLSLFYKICSFVFREQTLIHVQRTEARFGLAKVAL